MRKPAKIKSLSAVQAKQEADRLDNLAASAEIQIKVLSDNKLKAEQVIEALEKKRAKVENICSTQEAEVQRLSKESRTLELENTSKLRAIQSLVVEEKNLSKKVATQEDKLQKVIALNTKAIQRELEKLGEKKEALHGSIFDLEKEKAHLEKQHNSLRNNVDISNQAVESAKRDLVSIESNKAEAELEVKNLTNRLKELSAMVEELEPSEVELNGLKEEIEATKYANSELAEKVTEKEQMLEAFNEEMTKKTEAFRTLEKGIDAKIRRLKVIQSEKGIEQFLKDNEIV